MCWAMLLFAYPTLIAKIQSFLRTFLASDVLLMATREKEWKQTAPWGVLEPLYNVIS